jgi:hypothetical protein
MYIEVVPNRNSPPAILLRESYRQDAKVRKRALCNLSDWPAAHIVGPDGNRCRDLVLALLVGRILDPTSKLAAARALSPDTATSSLGEVLGLGEVDEDELYAALDWLLERQAAIEATLAKRHLTHGTLVLYDVSSSYMEGRCCPLAKRGYSRDGRSRGDSWMISVITLRTRSNVPIKHTGFLSSNGASSSAKSAGGRSSMRVMAALRWDE